MRAVLPCQSAVCICRLLFLNVWADEVFRRKTVCTATRHCQRFATGNDSLSVVCLFTRRNCWHVHVSKCLILSLRSWRHLTRGPWLIFPASLASRVLTYVVFYLFCGYKHLSPAWAQQMFRDTESKSRSALTAHSVTLYHHWRHIIVFLSAILVTLFSSVYVRKVFFPDCMLTWRRSVKGGYVHDRAAARFC